MRNMANQTVRDVRVEIHLSNRVELGPTPRVDLGGGETRPVELDRSPAGLRQGAMAAGAGGPSRMVRPAMSIWGDEDLHAENRDGAGASGATFAQPAHI